MSNVSEKDKLIEARRKVCRKRTAMIPLLAAAVAHKTVMQGYYENLYQTLTDEIQVLTWQIAAYYPQQGLFLDERAP